MRLGKRLTSLFFFTVVCASANAAEWQIPLRIGYVTWDLKPAKSEADLLKYLQSVTDKGPYSTIKAKPRFQLFRGNYYQVVSWLVHGDLDGAVLSPFTAFVIKRQLPGQTYPVVELAGSVDTAIQGGSTPRLIARRYDAGGREEIIKTPLTEYDKFIRAVWRSAATASSDEDDLGPFAVNLVNHLSTSGFILPIAYTHKRLHDLFDKQNKLVDEVTLHRSVERFWRLYFQYVHLTLSHGPPSDAGDRRNFIVFSFIHPSDPGEYWQSYSVADRPGPSNPNDVLVFRVNPSNANSPAETEIRELLWDPSSSADPTSAAPSTPLSTDTIPHLAASPQSPFRMAAEGLDRGWTSRAGAPMNDRLASRYTTATEYNRDAQDMFANRVIGLFGLDKSDRDYCTKKPLHDFWTKWYEERQYEFTVDELFELLESAGRASSPELPSVALVLPGGGVRGAYQATLLDQLYDNNLLANVGDTFRRPKTRLLVKQVIGTSGGALVGYFASQRLSRIRGVLRQQWIRDGEVVATPLKIVPFLGLPRWLSVLLIFAIFTAISTLTFGDPRVSIIPSGDVPIHIPVAIVLAIGTGPLLLWHLAAVKQDYTPTWEGLLYLIVILFAHFLLTTTSPEAARRPWRGWNVVALACAVLYAVMVAVIFLRDDHKLLAEGVGLGLQSAQAFLALLAVLGAAFSYTIPRGMMAGRVVRAYLKGLVAALTVIAAAFVVVCSGISIGAASWLELTWEYWIWIAAGAVIAATFVSGYVQLFGRTGWLRHLREAVTFWSELHTKRRLLRTPAESMMALTTAGIVLWVVFAAPALYSGSEGKQTFENSVEEFNRGRDHFLADFVVTANSLGTPLSSDPNGRPSYDKGDYYCCLGNQEGCKNIAAKESQQVRVIPFLQPEQFRAAVLASGSPFPIYPARRLDPDKDHAGMFIDGGYAHNTPIQAAQLLQARQVLIVHSARRSSLDHKIRSTFTDRTVGALATGVAGIFPFLLERSQAVDEEVRSHMFVASLAPYAVHGRDAFLMDFRENTIRELDEAARTDFKRHRIGQVESWGLPTTLIGDTYCHK